jgi:hypothetical protein
MFETRFYFICILGLLILGLTSIVYIPPAYNVGIVPLLGFSALILTEAENTRVVRQSLEAAEVVKAQQIEIIKASLDASNNQKAEQIELIKEKTEKILEVVEDIKKNGN